MTNQGTSTELVRAEAMLNEAALHVARAGYPVGREGHLAHAQALALIAIGRVLIVSAAPED